MKSVKITKTKIDVLNAYIGNEWADTFGGGDAAVDWLSEMVQSGHPVSEKSIFSLTHIEERRQQIEYINSRYN